MPTKKYKRVILHGGKYHGVICYVEKDIDGLILKAPQIKETDSPTIAKIIDLIAWREDWIYTKAERMVLIEKEKNHKMMETIQVFEVDYRMMNEPIQWEFIV